MSYNSVGKLSAREGSDSTYVEKNRSSKGCRNYKILNSKSCCIFSVFTVLVLVCAAAVALGANQFFGSLGSGGFNMSVGGGGLIGVISLGVIIYQIRKQCKQKSTKRTDFYDDYASYNSSSRFEGDYDPQFQAFSTGRETTFSSYKHYNFGKSTPKSATPKKKLGRNEEEPILGYN